jgi:hypothetical protein
MDLQHLHERLDQLVQTYSLETILGMLSDVCEARSRHTVQLHQDSNIGREWSKMAVMLDRVREEAHASRTRSISRLRQPRRDKPHQS